MKAKELIKILQQLDDDAEIMIVDSEQENAWDIIDCRTCEDNASESKSKYLDIVIDI